MTDTKQRFLQLLEILSFKAARLLVTFEQYLPSYLKPKKISNVIHDRNEFARELIEQELQEIYSSEQILHCRNIINANNVSKLEMGASLNISAAIDRFKLTFPNNSYIRDLNVLSLIPYRTRCNGIRNGVECGNQLGISFHMTAFVVYPTSIQPCTLYTADCTKCNRSYRVSSIYCANDKSSIIMPDAIQGNQFFHLSFGKLVYSREILVSFSSDLVNGHISFNGYGTSLFSKISRLNSGFKNIDPVQFTRCLEAHWIYYELFNFIFMTSSEKQIVIPRALFSARNTVKRGGAINAKAQFLEEHLDWVYNIFSIFWSHHDTIPECKCDKSICSRVLVLDGHQKPRRTICRYDNVTSLINVEELGPCNRGCPYQPIKRKNNQESHSKLSPYYCYYHQDCNENMSSDATEDRLRDTAWEHQLQILRNQTHSSHVIDDRIDDKNGLCTVIRSQEDEKIENKRRSMGFLASFLSCGIVIGFTESINHEGVRKVTDHLLTMIKMGSKVPNSMIYDAACNLKLFWNKNYGDVHLKETLYSKILFNMRVAVDRFHMKNHVRSICKTVTNPDCVLNGNNDIYQGINTVIAEQSFRYLTEFKLSLRRMAYPTSSIFSILLLHLWNCRQTKLSPDSFGLAIAHIPEKIKPLFRTCCIFETTEFSRKTISTDMSNLVYIEEENIIQESEEMEIDADIAMNVDMPPNMDVHIEEQLNYNCFVDLQQYVWDSDNE